MKRLFGIVAFVLILVIAGGVFFSGIERVKPGYVGIVQSKATGSVKSVSKIGWTFVNPFTQTMVEYPVSTEYLILTRDKTEGSETDESLDIPTKESKNINVDAVTAFHVTDAKKLFIKYRGADIETIKQNVIRTSLGSSLMSVTGKYSILSVNDARSEIEAKVLKAMNIDLAKEGIVIERFNLKAIRLPDSVQASFNAKVDAENKIRQAESKKQQAEIDAQRKIIEAEGIAKANDIVSKSLTPNLIELKRIEKLNPNVQTIYVPNNSMTLVSPTKQ